jgi:hypothetical protein
MDMRDFASKKITPNQVRDEPIQTRIVSVLRNEQYDRPVLELETGCQFTLNATNVNTLMKAFGWESNNWIGQEIVLELGTYKDWRADPPEDKETVRVRAVSPAKTVEAQNGSASTNKPLPPSRVVTSRKDDLDDEIPW